MSVTVEFPETDLGDTADNTSGWWAIENPIMLKMTRVDVTPAHWTQTNNNSGNAQLQIDDSGGEYGAKFSIGDIIKISGSTNYDGFHEVTDSVSLGGSNIGITINKAYVASDSGGTITAQLDNYRFDVIIRRLHPTPQADIKVDIRPGSDGIANVDVSEYLKKWVDLKTKVTSSTVTSVRETSRMIQFSLLVGEAYGTVTPSSYTEPNQFLCGVLAANQIGHVRAGNMGDNVAWTTDDSQVAKHLTAFDEPVYFPGYPFQLSFLFEEAITQVNVYKDALDINKSASAGSDGGNIASVASKSMYSWVAFAPGEESTTKYMKIRVEDEADDQKLYEDLFIKVHDGGNCDGMYLRWGQGNGAWDQWLFTHYNEVHVDTKALSTYEPKVTDIANELYRSKTFKKSSFEMIKMGSNTLTKGQAKGLQTLLEAPYIELYDKTAQTWLTVQEPGGRKMLYKSKSTLNTLEIMVVKPERYTVGNYS